MISGNILGQPVPILFSQLKDIQICCGPVWTCTTGEDLKGEFCTDSSVMEDNRVLETFLKGISAFSNHIGSNPEYAAGAYLPPLNITLLDGFGDMHKAIW